jgi:hypothetical protein
MMRFSVVIAHRADLFGGAVANAVYHATDKRVRHFPVTLDKLL